ncbi:unnamed protein product, partial [Rotaria sp. Silwood2]
IIIYKTINNHLLIMIHYDHSQSRTNNTNDERTSARLLAIKRKHFSIIAIITINFIKEEETITQTTMMTTDINTTISTSS